MRRLGLLLVLVAACGTPAALPAPAPPAPAPPPAQPPAASTAPPVQSAAPTASCAQLQVDLPVHLPPCSPPDAKEYDDVGDLEVVVGPFPDKVRLGAPVELSVTLKNVRKVPLKLRLSESQALGFSVRLEGDPDKGPTEAIEPLEPPTAPVPASCAHVDCPQPPIMEAPLVAPASFVTLAPGGVARVRGTWQPRRWKVSPPHVRGCCDVERAPPVPVGPLGPGMYIVEMTLPLSEAYGGSPGAPYARADIEIVR
jgi:hypothetical protein